jgi:hypothetical protein
MVEDSQASWERLGMPPSLLDQAVAAFGDVERAEEWIETLGKEPLRMVPGGFEPLWRNSDYLDELAAAKLDLKAFERWRAAGLSAGVVPRWAALFRSHGLGPDEFLRWSSAGFSPHDVNAILEVFDFETAMRFLNDWGSGSGSASELLILIRRGVTLDELEQFLGLGLRGHQILAWNSSGIPRSEWRPWMELSTTPTDVVPFRKAGFTVDGARPWIRSRINVRAAQEFIEIGVAPETAAAYLHRGVPSNYVHGFMELGVAPEQAADYVGRGLRPELLVRQHDGGLEEIDDDELVNREDLRGLPEVIGPGQINFERQSRVAGGDYVPYSFSISWNGKRKASWWMDISIHAGLSPASSSPSTGTISWRGQDLWITHQWDEMDIDEKAVFEGESPTDPTDPRAWLHLADVILSYVFR